jgi:hypothetical protein
VVSLSSIEHFGGPVDIARAAREIGRVLRPGGHAFVVTEVFVGHHPLDRAPALFAVRVATLGRRCRTATPRTRSIGDVFTPRELSKRVVEPSGLTLMQAPDFTQSEAARANVHTILPDGSTTSSTGRPFPHLAVKTHLSTFSSICLPLEKR